MAARIIEVAPDKHVWVVRDTAELRPTTRHGTRSEAIEQGHQVAETSRPCKLVVRGPDGSVAYEMVFDIDGVPKMTFD